MMQRIIMISLGFLYANNDYAAISTIEIPDTFTLTPRLEHPTARAIAGLGCVGTGLTIVLATTASALIASHKNTPQQQLSTTQIVLHTVAACIGGGLSLYGVTLINAMNEVGQSSK